MLIGSQSTGKTTTLNLVANELHSKQGATLIEGKIKTGKKDGQCILQYKSSIKIGIVTAGDIGREIIYNIGYYQGRGVDVLIIANRHKANAIEMANKKGSPFIRVDKIAANSADNDRVKNEILTHI